MVDAAYTEVAGLVGAFTLNISKNGGIFTPSTGVKAEIGNGWYSYVLSAAETNTLGPLSIRVTGAGCIQQNLEYVVLWRNAGAISYTYTVTDPVTLLPIDGVEVWATTDIAGVNVVWCGNTDAFGIARDDDGYLPWLDAGTYYFWCQLAGYTFSNPDTEVVS